MRTVATWNGSDPADPTVCLVTGNTGVSLRLLYGFYTLPIGGDEGDARAALASAFSGSTTSKCFQQTSQVSSLGGMNNTYLYEWCWKQAGQTTITIGGKPVPVIAFAATDEGKAGNYFAADWTYYYDPATHLYVEGNASTRRGTPPTNFVRTIVPPNT